MRLASVGDIHLTASPCKSDVGLAEQVRILGEIASEIEQKRPDGILLGGDLYDKASTTPEERDAMWAWISRIAKVAPIVAISGNPSHESGKDVLQLNYLQNVTAVARSGIVELANVMVGCAPWPQAKVENGAALYADIVRGLIADGADLLLLHADMIAAKLDGGQDSTGKVSSVLVPDDFGDTPTILYHYHKRQHLGANAWYGGAIRQMHFGDDPHKGFGIYDTDTDSWEWFGPYGRQLHVRDYKIVGDEVTYVGGGIERVADDALVRIRYEVPESERETARQKIDEFLGGFNGRVQCVVEPTVIADTRTRGAEVASAVTPREKLDAYWGDNRPARADQIKQKMEALG